MERAATTALRLPWTKPRPIEVDTTSLDNEGLLRLRAHRLPRSVYAGAAISFVDSVNELSGTAYMVRTNETTGLAYLHIDWETVIDTPPANATVVYSFEAGAIAPSPIVGLGREGCVAS